MLNESEIMDDRLYEILNWFRKIRNKAAHDIFFDLTENEYEFAKKSVDRLMPGVPDYKIKSFHHFCTLLAGTVWNGNLDVIKNTFP